MFCYVCHSTILPGAALAKDGPRHFRHPQCVPKKDKRRQQRIAKSGGTLKAEGRAGDRRVIRESKTH